MTRRTEVSFRATAIAVIAAAVFTAVPSWAAFTRSATTSGTSVSTATLAPPTAPAAAASCVGTLVKTPRVTVSWTATPSGYATGYAIMRLTAGTYVQIGTVSGRTTTSYVDSTVALATTYSYKVRATYQSWYAETAAAASATTAVLCV